MVKKQKIDLKNVGLLILAGFVWSKMGLGTAVTEIMPGSVTGTVPLKPDGTCPAGWVKVGDKCVQL